MVKYYCDCCGRKVRNDLELKRVEVLTGVPCKEVSEVHLIASKDLCTECAEQYYEALGLARYKVWLDLQRDKAFQAWEGMKHDQRV